MRVEYDDADGRNDQSHAQGACPAEPLSEDRCTDGYCRQRFQCPENRRERRPDEFDRPDQRDVGDRRGRERQSENGEPLFSVGHEPDTAREHTSAEKQQSSEGHDVKGQGGRFDLRRAALAYADDIAGIGEYRNGGSNGPRRGISAPAADSSGREEGDTGQRNADGRCRSPRDTFAEKECHGQGDGQRVHEMDDRSDPARDILIGDHQTQ